MLVENILQELREKSSAERKRMNEYFFKTGKGQYGEGDIFLGVSVPDTRAVAKKYFQKIDIKHLQKILQSKIHEERLLALEMLIMKYESVKNLSQKEIKKQKREYLRFYLRNLKYVNNWDLVDTSASYIVGDYLYNYENKKISLLIKLAKSKNLWQKRVGIVATYYFIRQKSYKEILEIAEIVKNDKHDLLQKALGWMLREVYKNVNEEVVRKFLYENIKTLPRTTLRYAIEKMEESERKFWLGLKNTKVLT